MMDSMSEEPIIELRPPSGYGWKYVKIDRTTPGPQPRGLDDGAYVYVPLIAPQKRLTFTTVPQAVPNELGADKPTVEPTVEVHDG